MFNNSKHRKIAVSVFIAFFVFVELFGLLLSPGQAKATPGDVVIVGEDITAERMEVKKTLGATLLSTALGSMVHAASYFMRKLAYDTATYLATGGNGEGALIFEGKAGDYFSKVGLDTAADAIEQLGQPFGLNLCSNPDLNFQVFLQIGLRSLYVDQWDANGPKPSCEWRNLKLKDHWETYTSGVSAEKAFSNALQFEDTDFGITLGAMGKIDRNKAVAETGAQLDRLEGQGFKSATELITGRVKEPAQIIKEESYAVTNKGQTEMQLGQVAGVYGSGALQIVPMAASVFLNTFMSQGLKTLQQKLLSIGKGGGAGGEDAGLLSYESAGFQSNRQKAEAVFSQILTIDIQQLNNYPLLEELAACPDAPLKPGLNNCVIDMGFKNALDQAKQGAPLTIQEAIDKGLLRGDWPLISPRRVADNTSKDCFTKGYCYSNLQKLRRSRILPLGFEIAAYLADPDNPETQWKLRQVVEGFDKCHFDENGKVISDFANFPYCHLIDPNWVLKAPDTRCDAKVYSSNLADNNNGVRAEECVDAPARLKNKTLPGTSEEDNFGYCTREKNGWNFGGDSCDKQYNTCTTFTSSKDGKMNSYLARTVDYGDCNLSNVGCLAYSAEKDNAGWVASVSADSDYQEIGRNQTLYFNNKIEGCSPSDNGCTGFYFGAFTPGGYVNSYNDNNLAYLKKAPDYLGCYDADPGTLSVDWPQTKPELQKIKPNERCSEFSGVCLPEEINCDSYTPVSEPSPLSVPAVVGENYCSGSCVGYDTYKQTVTNFAPQEFPLFFIPQNGKTCSGAYAGCDEFTNIDVQAKGGEGLEYYTDLKYCERPTGKNESVFYSWEGSKTEGYVLKTFKLRPLTAEDSDYLHKLPLNFKDDDFNSVFPVGSPAYASDSQKDIQIDYDLCNKDGYNKLVNGYAPGLNGVASADCRALYDKNGKVFYRLLKDTITISQSCHPLRKTTAYLFTDPNIKDQTMCVDEKSGYWADDPTDALNTSVCRRCSNGGFYENGSCIYWAISQPGEAESCPAEANGCREYAGNGGNNLQLVWENGFEPFGKDPEALNKAKEGWKTKSGSIAVAQEAIQVGGYSLQVNADTISYSPSSSLANLETNQWYKLSFWARGNPQSLSVYLSQNKVPNGIFTFDVSKNQYIKLSVGSEWQEYKVGPVQYTGDTLGLPAELGFERTGAGAYFLDNIRLTRVTDRYNLIKDSWKTSEGYNAPLVCDENPNDAYPGSALGCKLYTEQSTDRQKAIVGFEKMCREEAVGCRAVFDTGNTEEKSQTAYNVWCELANGAIGKCDLKVKVDEEDIVLGSCVIEKGASGCYVDKIIMPSGQDLSGAWIKKSTVVISADTPYDKPIYLTTRQEFQCASKSAGCQEVGAEMHILPNDLPSSFVFSTTTLLNNPARYVGPDGALCRDDLVGCGEFKNENDLYYFKDPVLTGNSLCEYKTKSTSGDVSDFGWFQKVDGALSCYDNYMLAGGENGIWSNNTQSKYKGMVGLCPDAQNGCREFIDPADTSEPPDVVGESKPEGKPYYAIYNFGLKDKEKECGGQVSLKKGCVLFNKTDEPNLLYNSKTTYALSKSKQYALVSPQSDANNDANHILKVDRERECAEWLACKGYLPVTDQNAATGARNACYALQLCQRGTNFSCSLESTNDYSGRALDYNYYIKRDVSWSSGRDFTGYSVFNEMFPSNFSFVNDDEIYYLTYAKTSEKCKSKLNNGDKCDGGYCLNQKCVFPITGQYQQKAGSENFKSALSSRECRGYPKQDSPFLAKDIVKEWRAGRPFTFAQNYENAKACEPGQNCDCDYTEVGYGTNGVVSETHYFSTSTLPNGICQGGDKDGQSAVSASDCGDFGSYLSMQKKQTNKGWRGYCLEKDISRRINASVTNDPSGFACLTWYPLEYVPDTEDMFSNDPTGKGYVPPTNSGQAYCTEMLGFANLTPDTGVMQCDLEQESTLMPLFNKNYCGYTYKDDKNIWPFLSVTDVSFRDVQEFTKNLLKNYLSTDINTLVPDTQPYISRVDVAATPNTTPDISCEPGQTYTSVYEDKTETGLANAWRKYLARLYGMTMSTQGQGTVENPGGESYAPLFPDTDIEPTPDFTWHLSAIVDGNTKKETPYSAAGVNGWDTGILRHRPDKAEQFIYKDMVRAVSIIPLWASKSGAFSTDAKPNDVPNMGQPMTIDLEKDYLSYPASSNKDAYAQPELETSGSGYWNRYWVIKTSHEKDSYTEQPAEGYVLQWFAADPAGPVGTDDMQADGFSAYSDTYIVNPLESIKGKSAVDCSEWTDYSDNSHFIAVEILFDKNDGRFIGYRSRNCTRMLNREWGYATAVVFHLKPMCIEAVRVQKDDEKVFKNKAWTDLLWSEGDMPYVSYIQKSDPTAPFGSIQFDNNLTNYASWQGVYNNPGENDAHAGRPWECVESFKNQYGGVSYEDECKKENYPGEESMPGDLTNALYKYNIHDLFAKTFEVHRRWQPVSGRLILSSWSIADASWAKGFSQTKELNPLNNKDIAKAKGHPPYIYPAIGCEGVGMARQCSADVKTPNNFAINGASGTKADESLLGKGQYTALAEFYAWANHNQMPIRRIMVDWKESETNNTIAGNMYGYYPNAKPLCADQGQVLECKHNGITFGLTCSTNADCASGDICETVLIKRFGNQLNSSCVETPMMRVFNYTCNSKNATFTMADFKTPATNLIPKFGNSISWSGWYNLLKSKGYTDSSKLCVFQPGVQVLDNWGWCSGNCAGDLGADGRSGCYEGEIQKDQHCTNFLYDSVRFIDFSNIIVVAL